MTASERLRRRVNDGPPSERKTNANPTPPTPPAEVTIVRRIPEGVSLELAAAYVLAWRGYYEFEEPDDPDDERICAELAVVRVAHPDADTPDKLADWWVCDTEEAWMRSLPVWACECGTQFKLLYELASYSEESPEREFYRVDDGGLLGECVGSTRKPKGADALPDTCPDCGSRFVDTIRFQMDPQKSLFV